jgi:methionyl-tRNA formyltransferase
VQTVYLGTSDFAAGILRALVRADEPPSLVVTRPDRPRGRGRKLASPPVADAARELGLPLAQPDAINSDAARAQIAAVAPEAVVVCAFGALIKEPLLSDYPMLNVHPSLLPRWRGAAPIERAIMAGDDRTGVSIMRVTAGLDSGPVYAQASLDIGPDATYGSLAGLLQNLGADLLVHVLRRPPEPREQSEDGVTYAEKITAQDRRLEPARPAAELERVVRALHPHIGAQLAMANGELLGVHEARVVDAGPLAPGALSLDGDRPVLGTAEGALELITVQPPGKRPMSGDAYLRGHRPHP